MLLMCMRKHLQKQAACCAAPVLCQWPLQAGQHLSLMIEKGVMLKGFTA